MQKCDRCNQDFYSDTEFREHRVMEDFQEMGNRNARLFGNIEFNLNMLITLNIRDNEGLTFEEAVDKHLAYRYVLNEKMQNDWKAKHLVV